MNTYSPKLKLSIINGINLNLTLQGDTKRYLFPTALLFCGLSLINPLFLLAIKNMGGGKNEQEFFAALSRTPTQKPDFKSERIPRARSEVLCQCCVDLEHKLKSEEEGLIEEGREYWSEKLF